MSKKVRTFYRPLASILNISWSKRPFLLFQVSYLSCQIQEVKWRKGEEGVKKGKTGNEKTKERSVGDGSAYTDTIHVLWCVELAEIDADTCPAVLAEHLIFILCVEPVVTAAGTAVVMPGNR